MTSTCTPEFWVRYNHLPEAVRILALKNYRLWEQDHQHPSLCFKHIDRAMWSVRVGAHYRALGSIKEGAIRWFWIGHHTEYDHLIRGK
jgi:hypothetical protein